MPELVVPEVAGETLAVAESGIDVWAELPT